jgi:hypothetical protein
MSATGFVIRDWGFAEAASGGHVARMRAFAVANHESPITNHRRSATPGRNA